MSAERSYIIEVLKSVMQECGNSMPRDAADRIDQIIERIVSCDDVKREIDAFYFITGYGEFTLRLLWMIERMRVDGGVPSQMLTTFSVEKLAAAVPKSL